MFEPEGHREGISPGVVAALGFVAILFGFGLFVLTSAGPAFSGRANQGLDLALERLSYLLMGGGVLVFITFLILGLVDARFAVSDGPRPSRCPCPWVLAGLLGFEP